MSSFTPFAIKVPATTANLGPGFDVLGLALQKYNHFEFYPLAKGQLKIDFLNSRYTKDLPQDESNLVYQVMKKFFKTQQIALPPIHIKMKIDIPPTRGFGSSSTAVVAGIVAANQLLGNRLDQEEMLKQAMDYEIGQHPDNVTPALLGGLVVNTLNNNRLYTQKVSFPLEIKAVTFVPNKPMSTEEGRNLLPDEYSKQDTIYTSSRVALFLAALHMKKFKLLSIAMQDVMHQPYRQKLLPELPKLIKAATRAGAHGAALSGGGPTILALASNHFEKIAKSLQDEAERLNIAGQTFILDIDHEGTKMKSLGEN